MSKTNDWIVASLNNPNFGASDFKYIANMSLDNTLLLSEDKYLQSDYIRNNDAFKDDNGNFSEQKFDTFYKNVTKTFNEFAEDESTSNYQYDMFDATRFKFNDPDALVKNPGFTMGKIENPDHFTIGKSGFNEYDPSEKSRRELALSSQIYDPETNTWSEKSLNEISLFENPIEYVKSLFDDPLVYATYDLDEEYIDPLTGKIKVHKKGEWKVNDVGEYYTEKLNGRSLIGKEVVSSLDYLTAEDTAFNKYDFMDSDDTLKSIAGSVMKNVAAIVPMVISKLNPYYSGYMVIRELSKTLPMLNGMVRGLLNDGTDSEVANTFAAYGRKFTSSTSDYAKEKTFSFENFANLMSDVALQWGQQRLIARKYQELQTGSQKALLQANERAIKEYAKQAERAYRDMFDLKLTREKFAQYVGTNNIAKIGEELVETGKWMETPFGKVAITKFVEPVRKELEKKMLLGGDLSLAYMALVSNTDVYESVKEHGGTPLEAAAITLGSTIGMFSVDKFLHLGEMFLQQPELRTGIRTVSREMGKLLADKMGKNAVKQETQKGFLHLIDQGITSGKEMVTKFLEGAENRSLGFAGKAIGEGLEEVSEELATDLSKSLGELAGHFGVASLTDYGAWDGAFDRYAMSFLGGTAGGAMFYGVDKYQNRNVKQELYTANNNLIYLIRNGHKNEILNELSRLRDSGRFGNKNLSFNITKDSDGKDVFLTAANESESQNEIIYKRLVDNINQLDYIINDNNLNLSESDLFDQMVQGEYRSNLLNDLFGEADAKGLSYITRYQEDFLKLASAIAEKQTELLNFEASIADGARNSLENTEKRNKFQEEIQQLTELKDALFGEGSIGYLQKLKFAMDPEISGKFATISFQLYVRHRTGKKVSDLTAPEKESLQQGYDAYKTVVKNNLDLGYKLYKNIESELAPEINKLANIDLTAMLEDYNAALAIEIPTILLQQEQNIRLESDTDEDYEFRWTKKEGESDADFKARTQQRRNNIEVAQKLAINDYLSKFPKTLDRSLSRQLQAQFRIFANNLIDNSLKKNLSVKEPISLYNLYQLFSEDPANSDPLTNAVMAAAPSQQFQDLVLLLVKSNIDDIIQNNKLVDVTELKDILTKTISKQMYDNLLQNNPNHDAVEASYNTLKQVLGDIGIPLSAGNTVTFASLQKALSDIYDNLVENKGVSYEIMMDPELGLDLDMMLNSSNVTLLEKAIFLQGWDSAVNKINFLKKLDKVLVDGNISEELKTELLTEIDGILKSDNYSEDTEHYKDVISKVTELLNDVGNWDLNSDEFKARLSSVIESIKTDPEAFLNLMTNLKTIEEETFYLSKVDAIVDQYLPILQDSVDNAILALRDDETIQSRYKIEHSFDLNSPIFDLVKKISSDIRGSKVNIELFLEELFTRYRGGNNSSEFRMSDDEVEIYKLLGLDLQLAEAYIKAASYNTGYRSPTGHNKSINEFVERHKDVFKNFEKLPEIDENITELLIHEILQYQQEMAIWYNLSELNREHKSKWFINTEVALTNTQLQFYQLNRNAFKISPNVDLLDGYESITEENPLVKVSLIRQLLHNNYVEKTSKGLVTDEEIFEHLFNSDLKIATVAGILSQSFSKINPDLKNFTDYDKFTNIISAFAVDETAFLQRLKKFIGENQNIAPISIQEYLAKLGSAIKLNPGLVNKALKFIADKSGTNQNVLYSTLIIEGLGGTGKTKVGTKLIVENSEKVWISGPSDSLINGLQSIFDKAKAKTFKELLDLALGTDSSDLSNSVIPGKYFKLKDGVAVVDDKIAIQQLNGEKPTDIIIDEATYLSTTLVTVLARWCNLNGIALHLVGDSHQSGFNEDYIANIGEYDIFTWRTNPLINTLRENNNQQALNQNLLTAYLDFIAFGSSLEESDRKARLILSELPKNPLHYYNGTSFTGSYITNSISDELLGKLNGSVGYVGDENDDLFKTLKEKGIVNKAISPKSVQGQEFDYVIINTDLSYSGDAYLDLWVYLKKINTLITRAKEGTILIDNGLTQAGFKSVADLITSIINDILRALPEFLKRRLEQLALLELALQQIKPPTISVPAAASPTSGTGGTPAATAVSAAGTTSPTAGTGSTPATGTEPTVTVTSEEDDLREIQQGETRVNDLEEHSEDSKELNISSDNYARVYTETLIAGIPVEHNQAWVNPSNTRRGLGILINSDDLIDTTQKKDDIMKSYLEIASLFNFGTSLYNRASQRVKNVISKDMVDNAEYYIVLKPENDPSSRLVGMSLFENSKSAINIGGKKYIAILEARMQNGKGETFVMPIGLLGDPNTWNTDDSQKIAILNRVENIRSLQDRYNKYKAATTKEEKNLIIEEAAKLKGIDDFVNTDTWSLLESIILDKILQLEEKANELEEFANNLNNLKQQYLEGLEEITREGERRINKPNFTGLTDLHFTKDFIRLEEINSDKSNYEGINRYTVMSEPMIILDEIPGIPKSLVGKPVIFVSKNTLLNSSELKNIYLALKEDPEAIPLVRMVVLSDVGVSFESTYTSKYKQIYQRGDGEKLTFVPYKAKPMAARMYISAWNYRYNLKQFDKYYQEFKRNNGVTDEQVTAALIRDNDTYNEYRFDQRNDPQEKSYRNSVRDKLANGDGTSKLILKVWEFNDMLSTQNVREIRLGYSANDNRNGVYVRKLSNLTDDSVYKSDIDALNENPRNKYTLEDVYGLYMVPSIINQHINLVDTLFEEVFNKMLPELADKNWELYITPLLEKGWFDAVKNNGEFNFTVTYKDENTLEFVTEQISTNPDTDVMSGIPAVLTSIMSHIVKRSFNTNSGFDEISIKYKVNGEELKVVVNWENLLKQLEATGLLNLTDGQHTSEQNYGTSREDVLNKLDTANLPIGIIPRKFYNKDSENGVVSETWGYYDRRMDTFFWTMFHGMVNTKEDNDFQGSEKRAWDAKFKWGMLADPIVKMRTSSEPLALDYSVTNRKLYKTRAFGQSPIIYINPAKYNGNPDENPTAEPLETNVGLANQTSELDNIKLELIKKFSKFGRNNSITSAESIEDVIKEANKEFLNNIDYSNLDSPVYMSYTNQTLTIIKLSDLEQLKGKNIETDTELDSGERGRKLTLDDGSVLNIYYNKPVDSMFEIIPATAATHLLNQELLGNELINDILNQIDDDYAKSAVAAIFANNGIDLDSVVDPDQLNTIIAEIVRTDSEMDLLLSDDFKKFLSEYTKNHCN